MILNLFYIILNKQGVSLFPFCAYVCGVKNIMLVSSIGHFSQGASVCVPESNKVQAKPVVTRGLTPQEHQSLKDVPVYKNLKATAGILFNMFSDSTKDMKRSLDMIA